MDENRSAICDDVDGDPVFLATSVFMMRRAAELAPALTFRDIKNCVDWTLACWRISVRSLRTRCFSQGNSMMWPPAIS